MSEKIKSTRIDVYFNKNWLVVKDVRVPSWIVRVSGSTYYVHHIESEGATCQTVLAPEHKSTNAFLRFSGVVEFINKEEDSAILITARITGK